MPKKSTRDLILGVAATLFATKGFRRTTMETIANAAGRGRRTVYMYFHDKVEIYNAVVAMEISAITAPLKDIVSCQGDLSDVIHRYAQKRCEGILALLKRNPLLLKDFAQSHNRVERLRESLNEEELKIINPYFAEILSEAGPKARYHSGDLAITFMNLLRGNDRMLISSGNEKTVAELAEIACDIFLKGIF